MPATESLGRRQCIPIIYTKGTHYDVGFDVGRNFRAIIHSFLESYEPLHEDFLPAYETPEGRKAYEDTLKSCQEHFPQYVEEIHGTADGAEVPFKQLFMLHLDNVILVGRERANRNHQPTGCSSICVNQKNQEILGHTEDALSATLNHFYFVSAHIVSDKPRGRWGVTEERFTSLCYAGHLPGYTMSHNHHGLLFSVNTLSAKTLLPGKVPRHVLTRALLATATIDEATDVLRNPGCGTADGCSINITFLQQQGGAKYFYNIEMAPDPSSSESLLSIVAAKQGDALLHCNSYLRLPIKEANQMMTESSIERMKTFETYEKPKTKNDVIKMLSDDSNKEFPVFRNFGYVKTIAVGIFDCTDLTWSLYSDSPLKTDPLAVVPLMLKQIKK